MTQPITESGTALAYAVIGAMREPVPTGGLTFTVTIDGGGGVHVSDNARPDEVTVLGDAVGGNVRGLLLAIRSEAIR